MSRIKKRYINLEFSIPGDELERHRIQLENNLQQTDLSLHLSSVHDELVPDNESLEYPRHNSAPSPFSAFASFENPSRDDFDGHSHMHAWSYHDEDGVNPYGAESMSTAAHHASALTLSAGLGGRGGRRDVSLSGAEYDPDRPLQQMIEGMNGQISAMDAHYISKSAIQAGSNVTFDPLVVDTTGEIDRFLPERQSIASLAARLRSPQCSTDSSSDSDAVPHVSSRPKLSDTLQCVSFSPKRPRNAQSRPSPHKSRHGTIRESSGFPGSRLAEAGRRNTGYGKATAGESYASPRDIIDQNQNGQQETQSQYRQPDVIVEPPTPSATSSKFTRMARDLAREIRNEQTAHNADNNINTVTGPAKNSSMRADRKQKPMRRLNPINHISGAEIIANETRSNRDFPRSSQRRLHLPDVTGLTSAVASPAKGMKERYTVSDEHQKNEMEARLITSLNALQSRLSQLESQNSIARRRVRELELELEQCREDVARERSRIASREEYINHFRREGRSEGTGKEKQRGMDTSYIKGDRYRQVVEEKKALEALISTLRQHLTRLTSDLSSQQEMLTDLRSLRETDAKTLGEKSQEINVLREEVERLAGEIEALRGVVEEGLQERRLVREQSVQLDHQTNESEPDDEEVSDHAPEPEKILRRPPRSTAVRPATPAPRLPSRLQPTGRASPSPTRSATPSQAGSSRPFVAQEELDRISLDLEERRSDRTLSSCRTGSVRSVGSRPDQHATSIRRASLSESTPSETDRAPSVRSGCQNAPPPERAIPNQQQAKDEPTTPFPQIRPGHLERLFFSAPEHNAKSCGVCHRRRRPSFSTSKPLPRLQTTRTAKAQTEAEDNDEGFHEGSENDIQQVEAETGTGANHKGKQREYDGPQTYEEICSSDILPPQTVLARVLRELEDDFTHYKSAYVELAEQYRLMDAVSNVPKRNILAEHLREVIDILERKGDQIASLYDLLAFEDKPVPSGPKKHNNANTQSRKRSGTSSLHQNAHTLTQRFKTGLNIHS